MRLTLYTAAECCLCHELQTQLSALQPEFGFELAVVDIAGDPELERRYRTEIPVLLVNGRKAVKHRISTGALRQRLCRASGLPLLRALRLR